MRGKGKLVKSFDCKAISLPAPPSLTGYLDVYCPGCRVHPRRRPSWSLGREKECILILPPERGHSCPQRAPSAHRFTYVLKPFLPRTLLRTGMSALRTGGSIKMHPGKRELAT